jgi:hypothetical protein
MATSISIKQLHQTTVLAAAMTSHQPRLTQGDSRCRRLRVDPAHDLGNRARAKTPAESPSVNEAHSPLGGVAMQLARSSKRCR